MLGLLAFEVLWLIAGNAFLATPLGPRLASSNRGKASLEWSRGWTVLPGLLHVRDLKIRIRTLRSLWAIDVERATLFVSLPEFALRRFHALHASGEGASLHIAKRRAKATEAPPGVPSIDAFESVPGPVRRLPVDHPWTWRFSDLEIEDLRELWVETVRYRSDGDESTLRLDFETVVRGAIAIPEVHAELASGRIDLAGERAGTVEVLQIDGSLDEVEKSRASGGAWADGLDGQLRAEVDAMNLAALGWFFRSSPVSLDGTGSLLARLAVRRGVLESGSRLEVPEGQFEVAWLDTRASGNGSLEAEVAQAARTAAAGEPRLELRLELDGYALRELSKDAPYLQGEDLRLYAESEALGLLAARRPFGVGLAIRDAEVPDLGVFDTYLPADAPVRLDGGRGGVDAKLSFLAPENVFSADVTVVGSEGRGRFQDLAIRGSGRLEALLPIGDLRTRRLELANASLRLDDVAIEGAATGPISGWWARGQLDGGSVDLQKPLGLETRARGTLRDSAPLVALFAEKQRAVGWFDGLLTVEDVDAEATLRSGGRAGRGGIEVHDLEVRGGPERDDGDGRRFGLLAQIDLVGERHRGLYFVELGPLSAGVEVEPSGRDWKLTGSRAWYEARQPMFW